MSISLVDFYYFLYFLNIQRQRSDFNALCHTILKAMMQQNF